MPVISMFYGIIVALYFFDTGKHNRPHIHVKYQGEEAVVGIPDGDVSNGERREFDVSPYLDKGIFTQLKKKSYFQQARVSMGTVEWPQGQDFCPDTLFEASRVIV